MYRKKTRIFMLMPFKEELTKIYEEYIKKPLNKLSYIVERADDFFRPSPILNDILRSIRNSDVIIAELTGRNANVFYELGRAHENKKYVIQICQKEEDIPFDLKHIRTIIYSNTPEGNENLTKKIKKFIATYIKEQLIDLTIEQFKESESYYHAGEYAKELIEEEKYITPKQIIQIAEATINNRQIYESDNARKSLEPFFSSNLDIIPKHIIKQLEYYGYYFENY